MACKQRIVPAFVAALIPITCLAGGSVAQADIARLLDRTPPLKRALESLEPARTASAEVRLGPHFKHLGGQRLGPYSFEARPKDGKGGIVHVTLCTTYRFVDGAGHVLPRDSDAAFDAVQVRERVTAVILRASAGDAAAQCP